jgi:ParB/RepB/Spo0J family partition protein
MNTKASTAPRARKTPDADTTPAAPKRRTVASEIDIDRIDRDPQQPRETFDEAALDELAASMKAQGQIQPVSVWYNPATRRYTLISGERRWRAASRAGLRTLHALVEHGLTDAEILARAVAENLGRKDMTPMEECRAFSRLVDAGYDIPRIAELSGKSREYVTWRIDLLTLIGPAREALDRGHMLVGTAWYVSRLTPAAQQRFLRKLVRGEFATARDAEAFAQACRQAEENTQGGLFGAVEVSDERREQIATRRRQVTTKMDQLSKAGEILASIAAMDVADLAEALAGAPGGVGAYLMRAEHIAAAATKTAMRLRKAKALAAAATPEDGTHTVDTLV